MSRHITSHVVDKLGLNDQHNIILLQGNLLAINYTCTTIPGYVVVKVPSHVGRGRNDARLLIAI